MLCFRAPPLRRRAPRAAGRKQSLANGQEPGLEFTDPVEKAFFGPFSLYPGVYKHTLSDIQGFFPVPFVLLECRHYLNDLNDFLVSARRDILLE